MGSLRLPLRQCCAAALWCWRKGGSISGYLSLRLPLRQCCAAALRRWRKGGCVSGYLSLRLSLWRRREGGPAYRWPIGHGAGLIELYGTTRRRGWRQRQREDEKLLVYELLLIELFCSGRHKL